MRSKKIIRLFTAMLAVVLCTTAFAVPASAGGGDGEPYYTETAGTEAAPTGDAESPEVTVTDDEDSAGNTDTLAGADTLDQLAELLGGLGTVTVTEEGIQFTPDAEGLETQQIGTVTTCGGNLNVRTGAGLENDAFTQLPNGAQVEVIGTEDEWVKVLLPEREGYVHSDYLTITDTGTFSLSLDGAELSSLLELFTSGLSDGTGAALTPDGNLSLVDDIGGTASGKQFITVETSGGNTFYIVIDYDKPVDEDGEQYHTYFLNMVDEADLLAALEAAGGELPACSCTEKCAPGAIHTDCEVCAVNMTECAGTAPEPAPVTEPAEEPEPEPQQKSNTGTLLLILAVAVLGSGAGWYFKIYRPKHEKAAVPEEDYSEELADYDDPEDDGPPWDEDDTESEDNE